MVCPVWLGLPAVRAGISTAFPKFQSVGAAYMPPGVGWQPTRQCALYWKRCTRLWQGERGSFVKIDSANSIAAIQFDRNLISEPL